MLVAAVLLTLCLAARVPAVSTSPASTSAAAEPSAESLVTLSARRLRDNATTAKYLAHPAVHSLADVYEEVRASVASRWTYDPELMCKSARVHGRVPKRATGAELPWRVWQIERDRILSGRQAQRLLPPWLPIYSGSEAYISDKYKFIYLRSTFSSSYSVLRALMDAFCASTCTTYELRHWDRLPHDDTWASYFVFTWVANPWQRMASVYVYISKHLHTRIPGLDAPGPRCSVPVEEFARDPLQVVAACEERDCCPYYQNRLDLTLVHAHLNDQSSLAFTSTGLSMVDFIGRSEHVEDDWAELTAILHQRSGARFKNVTIVAVSPQGSPDREGAFNATAHASMQQQECLAYASLLNETVMRSLLSQYSMDVFRFGFYLQAVPDAMESSTEDQR